MPARRESIVRYEVDCGGLPTPYRSPLRVPVTFDYNAVRNNIEAVVSWMIAKTTGGPGQLTLGPQLRYVEDGDRNEYQLYTANGGTRIPTERVREHMTAFARRLGASHLPALRLGVATLRWLVGARAHRSVLLCDARDRAVLKVYLIDPNGSLTDAIKRNVMAMVRHYFEQQDVVGQVRAVFLSPERMNVSPSPTFAWMDRNVYGLAAQTDPGAYCVIASLLIIVDVLCTKERILHKGHLERLNHDLSGGATDEEARRYNRLMSMRSFCYEVIAAMQGDGLLVGSIALPEVVLFVPVAKLPPSPIAEWQLQTVGQLRRACAALALDDRGKKEDLVLRLVDHGAPPLRSPV